MANVALQLAFSLYYYFIANTSITIRNNEGNLEKIRFYTNFKGTKVFNALPEQFQTSKDASSTYKPPFHIRLPKNVHPLRENTFYFLVYDEKNTKESILYKHRKIIRNGNVIAVPIDINSLMIIFGSTQSFIPTSILGMSIRKEHTVSAYIAYSIILLLFSLLSFIGLVYLLQSYKELDPPLDNYEIKNTNVIRFADIENKCLLICTICFDEFADADVLRVLSCKHYFHDECVDSWLIKHSNICPYCREQISIKERETDV